MATLAEVKTSAYAILNELNTSNVFSDSYMTDVANNIQVAVCDSHKFSFLRKKYLFALATDTTLNDDLETTDVIATVVSTSGFPTSGAFLCEHDIITYTGVTSTTFTGVTNIGIEHPSGENVYPLYPLPADYSRLNNLLVKQVGNNKSSMWSFYNEFDYDWGPETLRYTILQANTGVRYILLNTAMISNGDMASFNYLKTPTTLALDADELTIPDPYAMKIVPKLMAAEALLMNGDNVDNQAVYIQQQAERELLAMQKHFGESEQGFSKMIRCNYRSQRSDFISSRRVKVG